MSEELIDLMDELHKTQTLLDFTICSFVAMSILPDGDNLRLTESEAREMAAIIRGMVDKLIKRVEEAFKNRGAWHFDGNLG